MIRIAGKMWVRSTIEGYDALTASEDLERTVSLFRSATLEGRSLTCTIIVTDVSRDGVVEFRLVGKPGT